MMQTVTEDQGTGVLDSRLSHALDAWQDDVFPPAWHEPPRPRTWHEPPRPGSWHEPEAATGPRHMRMADPDLRPDRPREHRPARHRRVIEPAPVDLGTWFDLVQR